LGAIAAQLFSTMPIWAEPDPGSKPVVSEKSAEDILIQLLGGDRGVGGVRRENEGPGKAQQRADTAGRVAVPIQFEYDSSEITSASYKQLLAIADALNDPKLASTQIRIEGHSDNRGSSAYNNSLSQRRAEAVRRFLSEKGVAAERLVAKGYGKGRPLPGVPEDTDDGRAANRRVEFVNLGTSVSIAKAEKPSNAPRVAQDPADVEVVVTYQKGGESRVLRPGGVLTPNDNYQISFTPRQSSYVYVSRIDTEGRVILIFPNPAYSTTANPVPAKQTQVVPQNGKWLNLDGQVGEEEIVVLSSPSEIANPTAMAKRVRAPIGDVVMRGPAADPRPDLSSNAGSKVFSYRLPFLHE